MVPASPSIVEDRTLDAAHGPGIARNTIAYLVGLVALGVLFLRDMLLLAGDTPTLGSWEATQFDWAYLLATLTLGCYVAWPLLRRPTLARWYWKRLSADRTAVAALAFLALFFLATLTYPVFMGPLDVDLYRDSQPPAFTSTEKQGQFHECVGRVANGQCFGTLQHPLGTDVAGQDVLKLVLGGGRVAFLVGYITAMVMVPLGVGIGVLAGYVGGVLDAGISWYLDVQQSVPGVLIYILAMFFYSKSLFLFIAVFGLLNWGSIARVVRTEVQSLRSKGFVTASEAAGGPSRHVILRHVVPNAASTAATTVGRQVATLIVLQVALSYLNLNQVILPSWGEVIATGTSPRTWWVATFPMLAMVATVVSIVVLGDALRDVLDPRTEVVP